jgi:hypothetical protein
MKERCKFQNYKIVTNTGTSKQPSQTKLSKYIKTKEYKTLALVTLIYGSRILTIR